MDTIENNNGSNETLPVSPGIAPVAEPVRLAVAALVESEDIVENPDALTLEKVREQLHGAIPELKQNGMEAYMVSHDYGPQLCFMQVDDKHTTMSTFNGIGGFRGGEKVVERGILAKASEIISGLQPRIGGFGYSHIAYVNDAEQYFVNKHKEDESIFRGEQDGIREIPFFAPKNLTGQSLTKAHELSFDLMSRFPKTMAYVSCWRSREGSIIPEIRVWGSPFPDNYSKEQAGAIMKYLTDTDCPFEVSIGLARLSRSAGMLMGRRTSPLSRQEKDAMKPSFEQHNRYSPKDA